MDQVVTQRCGSCKVEKDVENFSPSYRGKPGTWCRPCFAAYNARRYWGDDPELRPIKVSYEPVTCTQCGEQYVPKQMKANAKRFCSRTCKDNSRNAAWAVANETKKPMVRVCFACGTPMPRSKRSDAKYCTDECGERARASARYNKTRGAEAVEFFTLDEIYERDAGVCYLCNKPCARCDASMEHVIPIGSPHFGQHVRTNVRLADLACNAKKGRKLLSELTWHHPLT